MRQAKQVIYPVVSLIIVMNNGNVTNYTLEDMTEACPGNATVEPILNMWLNATQNSLAECPLPYCNSTNNTDGICDPKIFVSWLGTDSGGVNLISSSQRFMNFKNYNLAGMWQSILGTSSANNSTDIYIYEPLNLNQTVEARLANPPATNLTTLNSNTTTTTNTTNTTKNTTANSTSTPVA